LPSEGTDRGSEEASVLRRERRVGKWAESTQRAPRAGKSSAVVNARRWKRVDAAWGVRRGKRRALQFHRGSSEGAAEIIVGVGVAARKARTSEPENRFHLSCRRATPEQVLGDPLIGDTPVGWRETLRDSQAEHPALIDLAGLSRCQRGGQSLPASRGAIRWLRGASGGRNPDPVVGQAMLRQPALGGLKQRGAVGGQAKLGVQQFHPGSVAAGLASCGLLIGEPGQPSQVTPIGAGQVSAIGAGQLLADLGSHLGIEWSWADVNPGLEVTGTGLEHGTGFMSIGVHGRDDVRVGVIEIDQDVAGVAALGVGVDVYVESLPIATTQKPYNTSLGELVGRPETLSRGRRSGDGMNETDQIKFVGHRRDLPADCLQGEKESAIHHGNNFALETTRRTMDFQRTATCGLTDCLSLGVHSNARQWT